MTRSEQRSGGMTFVEVAITTALVGVFLVTSLTAVVGSQRSLVESQALTDLRLRAQNAMERIVRLTSQAVTTEDDFSPLRPTTGIASHCLRFRLLDSVDGSGDPVYDDALKVYIYGPDGGSSPNRGIVICRGPNLATIHSAAAGPDGFLGTTDDNASVAIAGGVPAVELLIPERFRPTTGEMLTIHVSPAPIGRLITYTMRLNVRGRDGSAVLGSDLVLSERVALRK